MTADEGGRRLPPLNALKAFEATVRCGGVSAAARELGVTPGAVSQQVRLLESHAGAPLLNRDAGGLAPTELGARLLPELREAFEHLRRAAEVVYGPSRRRSLRVSAPPSFAVRWLAPRMARFAAAHPEVEVWLSADMQIADVAGGRADVAVRYGRGAYEGVRTEFLMDGGVTPVCSPALLAGAAPLRSPTDLARFTLIHVDAEGLEEPAPAWPAWLKSRGLKGVDGRAGPRYGQIAFAIEDAASGRGVALAPPAFVTADLVSGRLVQPFADGYLAAESAYRLVTRRGAMRDEARAFVAWLKAEAAGADAVEDEL